MTSTPSTIGKVLEKLPEVAGRLGTSGTRRPGLPREAERAFSRTVRPRRYPVAVDDLPAPSTAATRQDELGC